MVNGMLMVEAIRDALAAADPDNAAAYRANAEAYLARLNELDAYVEAETDALLEDRRKLVTSHDTFGYFADRYGYEAADGSAAEIAALVEQIKAAGVPAVFAASSNNPALMEQIAAEAGVVLAPTTRNDEG